MLQNLGNIHFVNTGVNSNNAASVSGNQFMDLGNIHFVNTGTNSNHAVSVSGNQFQDLAGPGPITYNNKGSNNNKSQQMNGGIQFLDLSNSYKKNTGI